MSKSITSLNAYFKMNNYKNKEFNNIKLFYFNNLSKLIPWYDIFHYYFYIIENKIYINDFEYEKVHAYFCEPCNYDILEKKLVFDYEKFENIYIDNGIIIKNLYTNAGHSFGNITQIIYNIFNSNIDLTDIKIIIPEHLISYNKFLFSVILLFFDMSQLFILKENMLINFKKIYIIKDHSNKVPLAIDFLLNKLKLNLDYNIKTPKNIFLIKSDITQNVSSGSFNIQYNDYFKSKNLELIIPENYTIIELFNIIYNAKNIVMSWGCNAYLNSTFINENSNILIIAHIRYENEYNHSPKLNNKLILINNGWIPKSFGKKLFLKDLPSILDEKIIELLDEKN